ncbi:MAG: hypothetical protein AB1801_15255 [Chloroflexota bacterium]
MAVDVELFGQLSPDIPRRLDLRLNRSMTVKEVAILLGVDPKEVGLVVINGVVSQMQDTVPPDGRLCFFPSMSGG